MSLLRDYDTDAAHVDDEVDEYDDDAERSGVDSDSEDSESDHNEQRYRGQVEDADRCIICGDFAC